MQVNEKQIGGNHYKRYGDLQPWDVVLKWNLGYLEGTALKYIARWRDKGGIDDIKKAIHFLEKLVEVNTPKPDTVPSVPSPFVECYFNGDAMGPYHPVVVVKQTRNPNNPSVPGSLSHWGLFPDDAQ